MTGCNIGLTGCHRKKTPCRFYSKILKVNCESVNINDHGQIDYLHYHVPLFTCVQFVTGCIIYASNSTV